MEENRIKDFWLWFNSISNELESNFRNEILLKQLDKKIDHLGNFTWEIGPGRKEPNMLVISPNGNVDLLEDTKQIIDLVPKIKRWEFYYAKQPRINESEYLIYFLNQQVSINISN
ncbi:MAG: hypothetical protein KGZ74_07130 [Chitinophagaceae bacterium]|nr:hypothetical protein [Chitinophagaceae bacterium]